MGKHVTIVANFAPRILRGAQGRGMILMTQNEAGKTVILNADDEGVDNVAPLKNNKTSRAGPRGFTDFDWQGCIKNDRHGA